jgi:hypothetical protein
LVPFFESPPFFSCNNVLVGILPLSLCTHHSVSLECDGVVIKKQI